MAIPVTKTQQLYMLAALGLPLTTVIDPDTLLAQYLMLNLDTRGVGYLPGDYGYKAWSFDPSSITGGFQLAVAGTDYGVRLWLPAMTVTNIVMLMTAAGAALTAGQCFLGLSKDGGALLSATADLSGAGSGWTGASGSKINPLVTPQVVTPGFYNVHLFANGTTMPTFARAGNVSVGSLNAGLNSPALRAYTADTALTTAFPGQMGAQSGISQNLWVAVN